MNFVGFLAQFPCCLHCSKILSIKWSSTRLGGPVHRIVTKTVHKTRDGGSRGDGGLRVMGGLRSGRGPGAWEVRRVGSKG